MRNYIKIAGSLMLAFLLSGCGIYGTYERPELSNLDNIYRQDSTENNSIAEIPWSDFFKDTCLQRYIRTGLDQNTDLQIAMLKMEEAEAMLGASRLGYVPSLQLGADGAVGNFDGNATPKTYCIDASSSWEIDIFGRVTNAKRQAESSLEESEAYVRAVRTRMIALIASNYYRLLMLDCQANISDLTLDNWDKTIQTLEALMRNGKTDISAVLQAKAKRIKLEEDICTIQEEIAKTENAICTILAIPSQALIRGKLEDQSFPANLTTGLPLQILSYRPDVQQAEAALKKAFYVENAARSAFYPKISLSGEAGWTNSAGGIIKNPASLLLDAVGSLVQPIFNRGKNKANLKIAQAEQKAAGLHFQQSILNAGKEVNDAMTVCQNAKKKQVLAKERIGYLEKAVEKTTFLMQHSSVNYLEVLTAEQALLSARMQQAQMKFDEINGIISLYHSLGGGLEKAS